MARRFVHHRRARLSECAPDGRVRLDALACWLQDAASEDVIEAGLTDDDGVWLVRKILIDVSAWPLYGEEVEVATWASGHASTLAERTTSIGPGLVEATAIWVCVDREKQRPRRLGDRFWSVYGDAVRPRKVHGRLSHPSPPAGAEVREWPLRFADLDRVGHINNAVYLEALEEEMAFPARVEVEFRAGLSRESPVELVLCDGAVWFCQGGQVAASILYW